MKTSKSRNAVGTYSGYSIIKVVNYDIDDWGYKYRRGSYFEFCKEGEEKRPSQAYNVCEDTIEGCKACIDKFIEDDSLYFTEAEREKYVYKPNKECQWGYGYNSLMRIMKQHQKADKRMKILLEDRLTDANFHSACSYLCAGDYEGFENWAAKNCKFNEKFEVYTMTMRKRSKTPRD